ncbi:hypothetical protein [Pontibacter sp. G13]|uniref:hypothetical protein n=1 Tax=Pontibacter sp. G13 TaxID=3074898 RepID=UPI0028896924|nr:hypothetical protein [Pontibacter sp. G13]WNJ16252.1 hypothetical protein RJD25_15420 [Pontibacter sp. G13]
MKVPLYLAIAGWMTLNASPATAQSVDRLLELADSCHAVARSIRVEASDLRKRSRAALKQAADLQVLCPPPKHLRDEKTEQELQRKSLLWQQYLHESDSLKTLSKIKMEDTKPIYAIEAAYREQALAEAPSPSFSDLYQLGMAQYQSGKLAQADTTFQRCHSLAPDTLRIQNIRFRIATELDPDGSKWKVKGPAEELIQQFGHIPIEDLTNQQQEKLIIAYEVMANYHFNPTGAEDNYHCEDARPYIEKILALDPNYPRIQNLKEYCEKRR